MSGSSHSFGSVPPLSTWGCRDAVCASRLRWREAGRPKGLIGAVIIAGATLLTGAAWGQCEVGELTDRWATVSLDDDIAVVGDAQAFGSLGAVFVYRRGAGGPADWDLEAVLMSPNPDPDETFGLAVVDADIILVGARHAYAPEFQRGAAYIYRHDGRTWQFEQMLTASDGDSSDIFGYSIAVDGEVIVVGARDDENEGAFQSGSAYVFRYDGKSWIEEAKLVDPEHEPNDGLGQSVAIRGGVALIGAHGNDDAGLGTGAAFIFGYDSTTKDWTLEQQLQAFDAQSIAWFGFSVALTEDLAFMGAPQLDSQNGAAYVMRYDGITWVHEDKLLASNPVGPFPLFGTSVSISTDGMTALIGAPLDYEGGNQAGAAHLFRANGRRKWTEIVKLLESPPVPHNNFGGINALSADVAMIGGFNGIDVFVGMHGLDCNGNGEPDACDIFGGKSADDNGNAIPDECESIPGDIDGDGTVGAIDLLILLTSWGPCENCEDCPADLDGNCTVGASDLLILLVNWG